MTLATTKKALGEHAVSVETVGLAPDSTAKRRNIALMLAAVALVGLHIGIFESIFNNYLDAVHRLDAGSRGILEFPRELPGFLVALLSGLLFLLPDSKAAGVAMAALAAGLLGLGFFSSTFGAMVAWLMLWSAGHHLFMPLEQSLAVSLADEGKMGKRLGQVAAASTVATIVGAGIVWIGVDFFDASFTTLFTIAAVASAAAGLTLWRIQNAQSETQAPRTFRSRFFFRREYGVFYLMCVLFGARKQVFITFAPWVLVQVFDEPASTIAKLWVASSLLGIVFKPALGRLIDRIGERPILVADAAVLTLVCLGYGFGPSLPLGVWGVRLAYLCFVLDQMLFAVGMARTSYLKRIAVDANDLTPTLSLGVSIDHAVSMSLPALGGLLWVHYGYPYVFAAAAAISVVNIFVCNMARVPKETSPPSQREPQKEPRLRPQTQAATQ